MEKQTILKPFNPVTGEVKEWDYIEECISKWNKRWPAQTVVELWSCAVNKHIKLILICKNAVSGEEIPAYFNNLGLIQVKEEN